MISTSVHQFLTTINDQSSWWKRWSHKPHVWKTSVIKKLEKSELVVYKLPDAHIKVLGRYCLFHDVLMDTSDELARPDVQNL